VHGYGRDYTPFTVEAPEAGIGEVISVVGHAAGEEAVEAVAA
jgi:hypothetical protein